jgi:hypothetical protein
MVARFLHLYSGGLYDLTPLLHQTVTRRIGCKSVSPLRLPLCYKAGAVGCCFVDAFSAT